MPQIHSHPRRWWPPWAELPADVHCMCGRSKGPPSAVFLLGSGGYWLPHISLAHPDYHLLLWLLQHPFPVIQRNALLFPSERPTSTPATVHVAWVELPVLQLQEWVREKRQARETVLSFRIQNTHGPGRLRSISPWVLRLQGCESNPACGCIATNWQRARHISKPAQKKAELRDLDSWRCDLSTWI